MERLRYLYVIVMLCGLLLDTNVSRAQLHYYSDRPSVPGASTQLGFLVSYAAPRNRFAVEFDRAPSYELFLQLRSRQGEGPLTARLGLFYTSFKPRLDTFPTYIVQTPNDRILPGYIAYENLVLKGLFIDYSYAALRLRSFRMDLGLGLAVGTYHMEYTLEYKTVLKSGADITDLFAGLRPKLGAGFRLSRHLELYGEYRHVLAVSKDWARRFDHSAFGLGLNFTFNPGESSDAY